jgi:hypothetical protein
VGVNVPLGRPDGDVLGTAQDVPLTPPLSERVRWKMKPSALLLSRLGVLEMKLTTITTRRRGEAAKNATVARLRKWTSGSLAAATR